MVIDVGVHVHPDRQSVVGGTERPVALARVIQDVLTFTSALPKCNFSPAAKVGF